MISKGFFLLFLSLILLSFVSCEQSFEPSESVDNETSLEDRLEVTYDEESTEDEVTSFRNTAYCSIFERLLEEKGYHVWTDDAAHYKAYDPATGKIGHMTLIPCSVDGDDSRIAIIQYFRGDDVQTVTAAEYFEYENYEVAHPVDERAGISLLDDASDLDLKLDLLERSESSKRYWQCVANRFIAGCAGCATVCYITGPAWGVCTAKCCAGSAVVALIACAITVYIGW